MVDKLFFWLKIFVDSVLCLKLFRLGHKGSGCFGQTLAGLAVSAMPAPRDVRDFPPMLCLDSGGVLTVQGGSKAEKHDGKDIYKATVPGAYALVMLWQHHYGMDSVSVVSRVNYISPNGAHWVERHGHSMGILPDQVFLVERIPEKADTTRRIRGTVVIDDRGDALQAQARGAWQAGSLQLAILFGDGEMKDFHYDKQWQNRVLHCRSHFDVMSKILGKDSVSMATWEWLCQQGPPVKVHSESTRMELQKRMSQEKMALPSEPLEALQSKKKKKKERNRDKEEKDPEDARTQAVARELQDVIDHEQDDDRQEHFPAGAQWRPKRHGVYERSYPTILLKPKSKAEKPLDETSEDDDDEDRNKKTTVKEEEEEEESQSEDKKRKKKPSPSSSSSESKANLLRRLKKMEERVDDLEDENDRLQSAASSSWQQPGWYAAPYYPQQYIWLRVARTS